MLSKYLNNHLFISFLSFFIPLFFIASLIFFIKIVSYTSVVQLSFGDLCKLYLFILPQILFFTLPVVFFIGVVSTLYKLSFEYEIVALFSLGVHPLRIFSIFFKTASVLSIILLILSIILIPQAKQVYKGFILYKKAQAKLNIKPSEFGHKFGDWYLYLGSKKKDTFYNVTLYNQKLQHQENFIIAKKATIEHTKYRLALSLFDGNAYTYENSNFKKIHFRLMKIYDTSAQRVFHYTNPFSYWMQAITNKQRAFDFIFFVLISLFPVITLFNTLLLGINNPRFEKRGIFLKALALVALFFGIVYALAKTIHFYALLLVPLWIGVSAIFYKKSIAKRF